jgi:AcrR family transcriptional regulator
MPPETAGHPPERDYSRAETEILAATERLLSRQPVHAISVSDITGEAGISRTSFYAYFGSRTDAVRECLGRILHEVEIAVGPLMEETESGEAAVRASLQRWIEVCVRHGALVRAVSEDWPHDPELREVWLATQEAFTAGTARVLRRARRHGRAPAGADPDALAACLIWANERVLHLSLVGEAAGLPDPQAIVEPLTQMVVGGLYGRPLETSSAEGGSSPASTGRP